MANGKTKSISAENTWTDSIYTSKAEPGFGVSISGTFVANVEVQRRPRGSTGSFIALEPVFTSPDGGINIEGQGAWEYRVGVPTGGYTSGTVEIVTEGGR
jgi:hypothetical protein